jgi:hypothetical protein
MLLAAFAITGELKYLHGRSMFCHSTALMITYASFAANYNDALIRKLQLKSAACYMLGEIILYFL